MSQNKAILVLLGLMTLLWPLTSNPAQAQVCEPDNKQIALQYYRRLSLDLRGYLPSPAELAAVAKAGKVSTSMIENLLKSEGFLHQIRQYHRDLLWGNVNDVRLTNVTWTLRENGITKPIDLASQGRRRRWRGANVSCLNEAARFDKDGKILCKEAQYKESNGRTYTVCREGWVKVKPYWSPTRELKVCAYTAQKREVYTNARNQKIYCSRSGSRECGCGPNLRWCMTGTLQREIQNSFAEQLMRFSADVVRSGKPYTEILLGRSMEINGPISHYLRYQTQIGGNQFFAIPAQGYQIPVVSYIQKTRWAKVQRNGSHAGVLTIPAFLMKFASDRGRANRFYNAFLCKHFQVAPGKEIPPASNNCHNEPNLTKRCGCKYCHEGVEPAAAYWGRWAETGLAPLPESKYPKFLAKCATPAGARDATCRRLYFTQPNHPDEHKYHGYLRAYVFATGKLQKNIASGPRGIAMKAINDGSFASCTTKKYWTWLMGSAPLPQQKERVYSLTNPNSFASQFRKNKHNLVGLIKAIVTSPEYKRGRLLNR